jgi:peptidoglycan-associated lipoprotein
MKELMKGVTSLMLVMLFSITASAQKDYIKTADEAFERNAYFMAIDYYKKGYARLKNDVEEKSRVIFQVGQSYRLMTNAEQAELWYKKAIKAKYPDPIALYYLGQVLKEQGKYADAIMSFEKYEMKVPTDLRGPSGVQSCKMAVAWIDNRTRWEVEPEYMLNSPSFDFSPAFGGKRGYNTLVFASGRQASTGTEIDLISGESFQDLYYTSRDKTGKWSEPLLFGASVNTEANEGATCLNKKGNTMFFTRCPNEKNRNLGCDIYMTKRQGTSWSDAALIKLKTDGADSVSVGHPAISQDDQVLIFASDMPGGYGGKDLWLSLYDKPKKTWGAPINLGSEINTAGDEMFPYLRKNGKLYFSSNGHVGMGGLDIFEASKSGEMLWGDVENMKYPINTNAHDYGIIFQNGDDKGFLTSNRSGGKGQDDIYAFHMPPIYISIDIIVMNEDTKEPIANAKIRLAGTDNTSYEVTTDESGHFKFEQKNDESRYIALNQKYAVNIGIDGHFNASDVVSTHGLESSTNFVKEVFLVEIKGIPYKFPEVQYPFSKPTLLEVEGGVSSSDSLDFLCDLLVENPRLVVELQAHTDTRGRAAFNRKLSQARAQTCVDYLVQKGIDSRRLFAKGMGEDAPRFTDAAIAAMPNEIDREKAHQANRRTEFKPLIDELDPTEVQE